MPIAALKASKVDHVSTLSEMPALLQKLVNLPAPPATPVPQGLAYEVEVAKGGGTSMDRVDRLGRRSIVNDGEASRSRCHIGHAYTENVAQIALDLELGRALASALRALEERAALMEKLATEARKRGHSHAVEGWTEKEIEFTRQAETIRNVLVRIDAFTP
jgi:two-component system, chemotaxis family, protein-glutamate methylesterase/glutaminase